MRGAEVGVVRALTSEGGPDHRLAAAISSTADLLALRRCHLYLRTSDAQPYQLVAGWAEDGGRDRARGRQEEALPVDAVDAEGAAQAGGRGPGLELAGPAPEDLEPVRTPVGPLLPLRLFVPGRLDAVLLMEPRGGRLSLSGRRRLDRLRGPLADVVAALHRESRLERELATATSRVETGRRLRDSALTPDSFLRLLLDLAVRATSSEGSFIAASDAQGRLALRVADGLPHRPEELDVTPETGVFDWSLADAGALLLRDPEQAGRLGIRSMLAVPLLGPSGPLGVVGLTTHSRPASFTEHNLRLLGLLAEQVGLTLENERFFSDFSDRYLQVLQGIAQTLDARRPQTVGYHERAGRVAAVLARALLLGEDEVEAARTAALIHDVGLAAVPGAAHAFLSDAEHPAVGASLLEGMPVHAALAPAIAAHHEWFDGWGFPDGLRGEQIPVLGRVLALAAFAAEMSTSDLTRSAWDPGRVVDEARRRAGHQFDPEVVAAGAPALLTQLVDEAGGQETP